MFLGSDAVRTLLLATLALVTTSSGALAETITAQFQIRDLRRCEAATCASLPLTFPLLVQFDDGLTLEEITETTRERFYGLPNFSAIPLRDRLPPDAVFTGGRVSHFLSGPQESGGFVYSAIMASQFTQEDGPTWVFGVRQDVDLSTAPDMTARQLVDSFRERDSQQIPPNFFYGVLGTSLFYEGHAFLDDGAPIPEPSSMVLLGSTAAVLLGRRALKNKRAEKTQTLRA